MNSGTSGIPNRSGATSIYRIEVRAYPILPEFPETAGSSTGGALSDRQGLIDPKTPLIVAGTVPPNVVYVESIYGAPLPRKRRKQQTKNTAKGDAFWQMTFAGQSLLSCSFRFLRQFPEVHTE